MKKTVLGIFILLFLMASSSWAKNNNSYDECLKNTNDQLEQINTCNLDEAKRLDDLLNQSYQELTKKLSKEDAERLKVSQRAWLKYLEGDTNYLISQNSTSLTSTLEANQHRFKKILERIEFFNLELEKIN